jgi:hypothetical protein
MAVTEIYSGIWQLFGLEKEGKVSKVFIKTLASFSTFNLFYGANLCADPCILVDAQPNACFFVNISQKNFTLFIYLLLFKEDKHKQLGICVIFLWQTFLTIN